jgi:DNA-binding NtrC family response regulator
MSEGLKLGPEIWRRVFSSPIFIHTMRLLQQIFNREFGIGDFEAVGISKQEWEQVRGPLSGSLSFPFCELIWQTQKGKWLCYEEDQKAHARLRATGKVQILTCHAGLTELHVPIMFDNHYYGCTSTYGGLLLHQPTQTEFEEIAQRVRDLDVDLDRLRDAYFQIKPIPKELLDVMITLLNTSIQEIIRIAVDEKKAKDRITFLEDALRQRYNFDRIIGKSPAMQEIFLLLGKIIDSPSPILIEGATGTGKELIASTIHYNSPRKDRPFTPINCAAFSPQLLESELFGHLKGAFTGAIRDKKGLFAVTDGGTIFLDEIAEMSPLLQVKLLRVLQDGTFIPVGSNQIHRVDVRVISATNRDLKGLVAKGGFREDLYYRLNVIRISLPALKDRKEDIPLLVDHFIGIANSACKKEVKGVNRDALKILMDYDWPGNIRELQNVIERAVSLTDSDYITPDDLPEELLGRDVVKIIPTSSTKPYDEAKREFLELFQKRYLEGLLVQTRGNISGAARRAGISRVGLKQLLKKHGLKAQDYRG